MASQLLNAIQTIDILEIVIGGLLTILVTVSAYLNTQWKKELPTTPTTSPQTTTRGNQPAPQNYI